MNSLISLVWQFEIPGIQVPMTILKNNQEPPHHYFYSEKQNRVLRKKSPNAIATIEQLQRSGNEPVILKTARNLKQKTISLEVSTGLEAIQHLTKNEFQGQYSVIPSNYELCLFKSATNGKQEEFQYLTCSQTARHSEVIKTVSNVVNNLCKMLIKNVEAKDRQQPKSKNEVIEVAILIGVDFNDLSGKFGILVIEALKLALLKEAQNIIQIKYEPKVSKTIFQSKNKNKLITQHPTKKQQQQQIVPIIFKQQVQSQISQALEEDSPPKPVHNAKKQKVRYSVCTCCDTEGQWSKMKEVPNQEYKRLRKLKNMGIRGFNDDYYEICFDCYQLL